LAVYEEDLTGTDIDKADRYFKIDPPPREGLLSWYETDTIDVSISDYDLIDPRLRPIFFIDSASFSKDNIFERVEIVFSIPFVNMKITI
jgi:hypothetical protein